LKDVQSEMGNRSFGQLFQGDIWGKIRASPKTAPYANQPDFIQLVNQIQQNPSSLMQYLADPRVQALFSVLLGVDLSAGADPEGSDPSETSPEPQRKQAEPPKPPEPELPTPKKGANDAKERGNQFYKKRDFQSALTEYQKALELDPDNWSILLNEAAVHFEMNEMDKCIETCKKVIEEGRSKKADFQTIAKAYNRIGNAYSKQEKFDEAIEAYSKSLTESSTAQTLQSLRKVEKLKRERDAINYIDPEKAQEEREKGNELFKQQKFPEAIAAYTEAIRRNPKDHVLFSNRAAAYTKLGEFNYAVKDCDQSLALNPNFVKSYIRKANLEVATKQYHKAIETFDKALKIEPDNSEAKEGLQRTLGMVAQQQRSGSIDKEQAARSMQDPEIQAILQDPKMRSVLNELQNDPQGAQHYLSDPVILNNINKLVTAGVLQVK